MAAPDTVGAEMPATTTDLLARLGAASSAYTDELVALRRDIHMHPELGREEFRTTRLIADRLEEAGLEPRLLPGKAGLLCDVGAGERVVAVRGDLDALPVPDSKDVPYRSTVDGVSHACGHDVHTVALLGVGLALADVHREVALPGRVRLVFQPAEEATRGGALDVLEADGLDGVERIFAVHCDPRSDVGTVGLRVGAITGSADHVRVRVTGPGGHTARPQLSADVVYALARVVADVPGVLSRRVDPRAALSMVWGHIASGSTPNAIPQTGYAEGTLRTLDQSAWEEAPELVERAVRDIAAAYGVAVAVQYDRGVPPVVNTATSIDLLERSALAFLPGSAVSGTEQSLGGEDFAWYLQHVPGALARLGTRPPGGATHDLHQGGFDVDERAIDVGVRLLGGAALLTLGEPVVRPRV